MAQLGRPKETPLSLLERDLSQTLRLHKEIRELIQEQIGQLREVLGTVIPIRERLEILAALTSMSESLTKSTQQSAKFVMTEDNRNEESGEAAGSLEDLLLGRTKGPRI